MSEIQSKSPIINRTDNDAVDDNDVIWKPDDNDGDGDLDCGNVILFERKGNEFHLAAVLRKYTSAKITFWRSKTKTGYQQKAVVRVEKEKLWDALGLLRSLQYDVAQYNSVLEDHHNKNNNKEQQPTSMTAGEAKYRTFRLSRQAAAMGVRLPSLDDYNDNHHHKNQKEHDDHPAVVERIHVKGLDSLIEFIEHCNQDLIQAAHANIQSGFVDFDSLQEYFKPGQVFVDHGVGTGVMGVETLMRTRACYYARRKSLLGWGVTFYVAMEVVVSTGDCQYAVVETQYLESSFHGTKSIHHSMDLFTKPTTNQLERLVARGMAYQQLCGDGDGSNKTTTGTGIMVEYSAGTFLPTAKGRSGATSSSYGQASRSEGRMMVDTMAAWSRGVNCAIHSGVASDQVIGTLKTYAEQRSARQQQQQQRQSNSSASASVGDGADTYNTDRTSSTDAERNNEFLILASPLPESLVGMTWPVVPGFSLTARTWGVAMVHGTRNVQFNEQAFDSLVMSASRKKLIQALVTSHEAKRSADLIAGKGEGSIFLLHGPPGVGKTLTAEAISEMLHKPLYVVSMGELGTSPEALEARLRDVLDLCVPWKALVLIDEAEMLLERRTKNDIVRNAMVCVMLRLLEYYSGILFLTTNRVESLDPAFQSRVTCALRYDALSFESRKEIWTTVIRRLDIDPTSLQIDKLAQVNINGRQIKNTLQLAAALAQYDNVPVDQAHLETTLEVTTSFLTDTSTSIQS